MGKLSRELSEYLVILSASLGIAGTLADHGIAPSLLFAQVQNEQITSPANPEQEKINRFLELNIEEILFDSFSRVEYFDAERTDNLQTILEGERTPAVVFLYDPRGQTNAAKHQATVLRLVQEQVSIPIRFIAFSYDILPGNKREKDSYLLTRHGFPGTPTTSLYVPSTARGASTISLDTYFGAPRNVSDIIVSAKDFLTYWFGTNILQSGDRTVYRFRNTADWHELRADGRGNILDPSDNNRVVGVDVAPELVRLWTAPRTEQPQDRDSQH